MFLKIKVLCLAVSLSIVDCQNEETTYLDPLVDTLFTGYPSTNSESPSVTESLATTSSAPEKNSSEIPGVANCTCIPYNQCYQEESLIDIHVDDSPQPCPDFKDVCCQNSSNVVRDPPTTTAPSSAKKVQCGLRNSQLIETPLGDFPEPDNDSGFGEFPWMVAVYADEGNSTQPDVHKCGGSLIHPLVVLTAAHCVTRPNETRFKIRAGDWDTTTEAEPYPHQDREVGSVIVHPQFHSGALHNDVALLFLKTPVTIDYHVNVVCLPSQGQEVVIENARCFANGWGIGDVSGNKAAILKKVELPIIARPACQDTLRSTRLGKWFKLDGSFICAGGEVGKNTCTGDGGSPLVCEIDRNEGRYAQFGIVSWGIDGCFENTNPGVYANVALFRNWIDQQMIRNHLDFGSYQY